MRPIMVKTWIEVIYWDCGIQQHRHKSEDIAAKCMAKYAKRKSAPMPIVARRARWVSVMRAVVCGADYKEAGDLVGMSGQRCSQVVRKLTRICLSPKRLVGVRVPDHEYWKLTEIRKHQDFWLTQIDKVEKEWIA